MIAPHAIQRHPSNAQPRLRVLHSGCRRACWAMMMRQARRSSAIQHYTVRCGFLSQRSYVAPSRQRRSSSKRPRKELTYCPIYGFKSFLICAKELTPALFCCRAKADAGAAEVAPPGNWTILQTSPDERATPSPDLCQGSIRSRHPDALARMEFMWHSGLFRWRDPEHHDPMMFS